MLILIGSLSLPAILAQITNVLMFFIDAAMVGHLGAEPSASIGLVESTTWLFGAMTSAARWVSRFKWHIISAPTIFTRRGKCSDTDLW